MDLTLRCNSLKCRTQLIERAVVTTCSHIFCIACSDSSGLSNSNGGARICPACETHLTNPDDAVVTHLNPTEDYKTSVLSGLSPSIIMECAGRGLAFYSYQTTQEVVYQEFLAKFLTDKYATLSSQMDKIIHDANSEIMNLRDKLSAMQIEQKGMEQRNHELVEAFREKSKNQQQLQKLYQSLKAQVMATQVQTAAFDDAEQTLQTATSNRFFDRLGTRGGLDSQYPHFPVDRAVGHNRQRGGDSDGSGDGGEWRNIQENGFSGHFGGLNTQAPGSRMYSSQSAPVAATPSQHRTRSPVPLHNSRGTGLHTPGATSGLQSGPFTRQPLSNLSTNTSSNLSISGYGMSAGMKVGKLAGGHLSRATPRINRQVHQPNVLPR